MVVEVYLYIVQSLCAQTAFLVTRRLLKFPANTRPSMYYYCSMMCTLSLFFLLERILIVYNLPKGHITLKNYETQLQ